MTLLEFLASLATDTEFMSAFRRSPQAAFAGAGLSADDQRAILDGDPVALRQAVYAESFARERSLTGKVEAEANSESLPVGTTAPPMLEKGAVPPTPPPPPQKSAAPRMLEEGPPPMLEKGPPPMLEKGPPPPMPEKGPPPMPEKGPPPMLEKGPPPMLEKGPPPAMPEKGPPPAPEKGYPPVPEKGHPPTPEKGHPPMPEKGPPPEHSTSSHEVESVQVERLDSELDLAQDALLAGLDSSRAADLEPCGVWSSKGLTVVGMGMRAGLHMTVETRLAIEQASRVLYLVADPVSEACIRKLNPNAQTLGHMYEDGKPRIEIYEAIIGKILDELESAGDLCVAFYGHPGVLSYPAWESIRRARATGKRARMLPAISTEDALFADLGIDIGRAGLQSFEATRFLYYKYNFDSSAGLLLWQVSVLGEYDWNLPRTSVRPRLEVLVDDLMKYYSPEHEVFLYHAPELPTSRPLIERVALRDLPKAEFISISTLYIPPRGRPQRNEENLQALERIAVQK